MSDSRLTQRVGLFVVICLALLVALLLSFSKGLKWFTPTYELRLRANSVGGLQKRSLVMMSGITIGSVLGADIAPNGKGVVIRLNIDARYNVHSDARFVIEQIGFLGDQYVAIYPQDNQAPLLKPGEEVTCAEPLSIQEVVRTTGTLMQQVDLTVKTMQHAIERMDRTVLSENTLTNLQAAVASVRVISDRTLLLTDNLNHLVATNASPISLSISNLVRFSETMDRLSTEARQTLAENRDELSAALQNLESASRTLDAMGKDLQAGKGLAGALLQDNQLKSHILNTAASLDLLSSNLSRYGLLFKPKPPKTVKKPTTPLGKNPFQ